MDPVQIPLPDGSVAIIDAEDYERLCSCFSYEGRRYEARPCDCSWSVQWGTHCPYVISGTGCRLHRLVSSAPAGMHADHKDFDTFNISGVETLPPTPGRWLPVTLPTFPPREKAKYRLCWATIDGVRQFAVFDTGIGSSNVRGSVPPNDVWVETATDIFLLTPEYLDEVPVPPK